MTLQELLGEGYKEGMSLDDVSKVLEGVEMPIDNSAELEKLKNQLSNANSEAANYKKQLRDKLSEEERKAAEVKDQQEKLQNDYNTLLTKVNTSERKAELLALGYEDKLAQETAEAIVSGDFEKVLANQKAHQEALKAQIKADILKGTQKPVGGQPDVGMDYDKKIAEAQSSGDYTAVAYYTRLKHEATKKE